MVPIGCPEMSVGNYHYLLCNNPEQCSSQLLCGGSLKSGNVLLTNETVAIVLLNTFTAGYLNAHWRKNASNLKGPQPVPS
jgi:hypothetical protein